MKRILFTALPILFFLLLTVAVSLQDDLIDSVTAYIKTEHLYSSYGVYVLFLIVAVVCMPFTAMPLIPIIAGIFGPFVTGVLSVIGWTLGSMVAFLIARYLGKPVLQRYIPLQKLDDLLAVVPERSRFLFIVLLRLTLPVDVVSYALGLTKSLGFIEYSIASFVGVLWFSFAFAYLGNALLSGDLILAAQLTVASLVIFAIGWYLLKRSKNSK